MSERGELCLGRVRMTAPFLLAVALLCFFGQEWLLVSFGGGALVHELGHLGVALLCGGRMEYLRLSLSGGELRLSGSPNPAHAAMILAAGPLANLLQAGLCARLGWPLLAGAGLILGLLNLLPVLPLDGGQLMRLLLTGLLGVEDGTRLSGRLSLSCALALLAGGLWLMLEQSGTPALALFALWLVIAQREFGFAESRACHFPFFRVK
ncbi:MAG: M50 family metallopeptidase [Oscillospiraceae bacterium]|nr:M50 family metallopeptidase [Oscillospiraceae bacterium]